MEAKVYDGPQNNLYTMAIQSGKTTFSLNFGWIQLACSQEEVYMILFFEPPISLFSGPFQEGILLTNEWT